MYNIVVGYKVSHKTYYDFNILIGQIMYTVYKCYFKSDRRSKSINMLYSLYYDLLTLEKYFSKINSSRPIISKFASNLKDIL